MSDRELLELAAKAAGMGIRFERATGICFVDCAPHESGIVTGRSWNPLTEDGDALRLAVECGMNIYTTGYMAVTAEIPPEGDEGPTVAVEPVEGDKYLEATRRAIVRAAAELGRAK